MERAAGRAKLGLSQAAGEPGPIGRGSGMSKFKKAGLEQESGTRAAYPARAKAERGTERREEQLGEQSLGRAREGREALGIETKGRQKSGKGCS